jgi:hypothetical protein
VGSLCKTCARPEHKILGLAGEGESDAFLQKLAGILRRITL